jgi:hypothetical protein
MTAITSKSPASSFAAEHDAQSVAVCGLVCFFAIVAYLAVSNLNALFLQRHGWSHRVSGGFQLVWLIVGCLTVPLQVQSQGYALGYDIILGCAGILSTYTASRDFPHRYIRNAPGLSGTLSQQAMVTQAEMVEHLFYQGLNLWQVLYIHAILTMMYVSPLYVWLLHYAVTLPWCFRHWFPVHSFSQNWKQVSAGSRTRTETFMYRLKKAQYLFYKHFVFFGLNMSLMLRPHNLVATPSWRVFWLSLNTAYVMEFFLQTLVRRHVLSQSAMLALNWFLMVVSSLAAITCLLPIVSWPIAGMSTLLNIINRHHDVINTIMLSTVCMLWKEAVY